MPTTQSTSKTVKHATVNVCSLGLALISPNCVLEEEEEEEDSPEERSRRHGNGDHHASTILNSWAAHDNHLPSFCSLFSALVHGGSQKELF